MPDPLARRTRLIAEITLVCPKCFRPTTYGIDQANIPDSVMCSTVIGHDGDAPINCGHTYTREDMGL